MKSFAAILILSLFAAVAFCQPPVVCDTNAYTADEQDQCMLQAQIVCGDYVTMGGCSDVHPYDANGNFISCEQACSDCINCVGVQGDACCVANWWPRDYEPCMGYCQQFY